MRHVPVHPIAAISAMASREKCLAGRKAQGRHAERPAAHAFVQARGAHHACMAQHALAEEAKGEQAQAQHDHVGAKDRLSAATAKPSMAVVA